jgi:2-oxoglutarate ferredoxin oxidoreductase subunit gamma
MERAIVFAGFGGQGLLFAGEVLARAALTEGKEVLWLPSYGPEMRGGTAYCSVVVSDRPIGSPIISAPRCAAVMNRPSFDKFSPLIKPDGLLVVNSSLIDVRCERKDLDQVYVPANEIAIRAGSARAANMAMLGAFVGRSRLVKMASIEAALREKFGDKPQICELNLKVLAEGAACAAAR